jgi:hypothetical protein
VSDVEVAANDDMWKLIGELGLLEKTLGFLTVIIVALTAEALRFANSVYNSQKW